MTKYKKVKINSLRFLIFTRIIIYLVILVVTFGLFFYAVSEVNYSRTTKHFLIEMDMDYSNYDKIPQDYLDKNGASLEVIDENLNVIYTRGVNTENVKSKYTPHEFVEITLNESFNYNAIVLPIKDDAGRELTLLFKQYITGKDRKKIGQNMIQYIIVLILGTIFLLVFSYILLTRNIFRSIKREFDFIQKNISRTPYDRSKLNLDKIPLLETREVAKSYNNMLDEMEKIKSEKDMIVKKNNRLISNLSHDLKSPITTLRGYWEIISDKNISECEKPKYYQYMDNSINDLNHMITMLFDQLKYQYSDYKLNLVKGDLNNFLRDICANYYMIYDKKGFEMEVRIQDEPFITMFDPVHMKRVFTNILDNCLNHNPNPTKMIISTKIADDILLIFFKDNGVGINFKDRDKLFEAFYQGDESRTKSHGGLGLYIVKQILLKHGGDIRLLSHPNYSTVFEISIDREIAQKDEINN